ncbi:MAG: response regulator transcription factor [Butyricicoccaceae bacterium]
MKIYIVEDDLEIRELESYALTSSGFETVCFAEGESFLRELRREKPALVLLDVMLPGKSGLELLQIIRSEADTAQLPVILVTAKSSELDTVRGLDMGADDYISKPFGVMELVSRVRARTRNVENADQALRCGPIVLNESSHTVSVDGQPCDLTFKEFELLALLMQHTGQVLSRERIMERIWGYDYGGSSRTLDMHIKTLRQKLGSGGPLIHTIRNVGYRISES